MATGSAQGAGRPDPAQAVDLAEFVAALRLLRIWAGTPSYRALAKQTGDLLRPPQPVSFSTIADVFKADRRRLDLDLVTAIVRALGLAEPEAAAWRAACIRVHAGAKTGGPVGVLQQLPRDLTTFTGRTAELEALLRSAQDFDAAAGPVVISAVEGMAGVGKTQLAVHAAHELVRGGRFTELQLFVDLRGFDPDRPPADPAAVLDGFLRALGVPAEKIPSGLDARAAMYRDQLHGRAALVVLDNAADEAHVRHLIPAGPDCLVLITSRRTLSGLDGAALHRLDVFPRAEAVALLAQIAGAERIQAEPEAAAAVAAACGDLPLAVSLAAARLRSRPAWTVEHLAQRLHEGGLDAMAGGQRSLRAVFDLSYRGLPESARRLFCLLGLFPGDEFGAEAVAEMAGLPVAQAQGILEKLQDEYLLHERSQGRYVLHDLLRAFAADRANADLADGQRRIALELLASWYAHTLDEVIATASPFGRLVDLSEIPAPDRLPEFASAQAALDWCDAEFGNIIAVMISARDLGYHGAVWRLASDLATYMQWRWSPEEFMTAVTLGLESARQDGHRLPEVVMLSYLADHQSSLGNFEVALDAATSLYELSIEARFPIQKASAAGLRGRIHDEAGDLDAAIEWHEKAVQLHTALEITYNIAASLHSLAGVYVKADRRGEAEEIYHRILEIYPGDAGANARAWSLESLGRLLSETGRHDEAVEYLNEAVERHQSSGRYVDAASALEGLGSAHLAADDPDRAREAWRRALAVYQEHDHPDAPGLAEKLGKL